MNDENPYVILRNKITRLLDVIEIKTGTIVSRNHRSYACADEAIAKLPERVVNLSDRRSAR